MADLVKTFEDLVKSNNELVKKFQEYVDASDYQGKDPKKWLGDLSKAIKAVEAALADTKNKLAATKKALEEFVNANKEKIKKDNAAKQALQKIYGVMEAVEGNIKKIELHLNRQKA